MSFIDTTWGLTDDPVDVISMDEAEMLVEAVVDHQCPGKDKCLAAIRRDQPTQCVRQVP